MTIGEVLEHFWPLHLDYMILGGGTIGFALWGTLFALFVSGGVCLRRRTGATAFFTAAHLHNLPFVFFAGIMPAYMMYAFLPSSHEEARQVMIEIFSRALLAVLLGDTLLATMAIAVRIRCVKKPSIPRLAWISLILMHVDFIVHWMCLLPIGRA